MNADESLCQECLEAGKISGIDIKRLLLRLTEFKYKWYPESRGLSDLEIRYLCLCLSRYSKGEIAYYWRNHRIPTSQELAACEHIEQWMRNLNSYMSNRIHRYVKEFMNLAGDSQRMPSWREIIIFLESSGYKISQSSTSEKQVIRVLVEGEISVDELNKLLTDKGFNIKISRIIDY